MEISKKMTDALNEQINAELYSSYMYLSMSSYLESINFSGSAQWMVTQAQEEVIHAMKIFAYINERGGRVILDKIEKPPKEWESLLDVFEQAYKHEVKVTGLINNLVELSNAEKDHATIAFLQWFITEQVEEEASADKIIQNIKMIGKSSGALYMLDRKLGSRPSKFPPVTSE